MKGAPMTEELYEYIVDRFGANERELLATMANRAQRAGLPMIMIAEDQARFLRVLLRSAGAKRCLDVGTLFGYSAAVLALATGPKGKVVSIELVERNAKVARENLEHAGLDEQVEIRVGNAHELMRKMRAKSFDFVLIDAEKTGYEDYFDQAVRLTGPGGLIAVDNTMAWGHVADRHVRGEHKGDVLAIQRFNDVIAARDDVDACLLPIGDGLLLARVKD